MTRKIRVLLCDDHAMMREGLRLGLSTDQSFTVIAEADNGEDAVKLSNELKPDVIIMDINMPGLNGIEAARKIKMSSYPARILMLTMHESENYIKDALSSGIDGYIFKMADMEEFIKAVRTVAGGKNYFHENVTRVMLSKYVMKSQKDENLTLSRTSLTKREKQILKLIAEGKTSQEIAERLFISYFTVGKHRKNIMHKLDLKNTAELIKYALSVGIED